MNTTTKGTEVLEHLQKFIEQTTTRHLLGMKITTSYHLNDCQMASLEAMTKQSLLWYGERKGTEVLEHLQKFVAELSVRTKETRQLTEAEYAVYVAGGSYYLKEAA